MEGNDDGGGGDGRKARRRRRRWKESTTEEAVMEGKHDGGGGDGRKERRRRRWRKTSLCRGASSKRSDQRKIENLKKFVRMTDSSNNNKFVQPVIPKFDGFYEHWAKLMENFLSSKEMWNLVEDGIAIVNKTESPLMRRQKQL
ncbi:hypothetical protein KIW84_046396 [Lathyrus oleraceus]|uniref:Uncharacterized protein n=1 Tax=Pisum sativum TaxID=3888 RepID=A0A9D4XNV6_PEA|nr:hypothetical protein KIW84_046396 [Pisum sativum]